MNNKIAAAVTCSKRKKKGAVNLFELLSFRRKEVRIRKKECSFFCASVWIEAFAKMKKSLELLTVLMKKG